MPVLPKVVAQVFSEFLGKLQIHNNLFQMGNKKAPE